jgi:hypothetical protein
MIKVLHDLEAQHQEVAVADTAFLVSGSEGKGNNTTTLSEQSKSLVDTLMEHSL